LLVALCVALASSGPVAFAAPGVPQAADGVANAGDCVSLATSRVRSEEVDVVTFEIEDYRPSGGHLWIGGMLRNNCAAARRVGLSAVVRTGPDATSPPAAASTTVYVDTSPKTASGFVLPLTGDVPAAQVWISFRWNPLPVDDPPPAVCVDVHAERCLVVAPELADSVAELGTLAPGADLLRTAADLGVEVQWADLGDPAERQSGAFGRYEPESGIVRLNRRSMDASLWERAAYLSHQLQTAISAATPADESPGAPCAERAAAAFRAEGAVWNAFWRQRLPPPATPALAALNRIASESEQNPARLVSDLGPAYGHECLAGP
jgi:hypothetical protein